MKFKIMKDGEPVQWVNDLTIDKPSQLPENAVVVNDDEWEIRPGVKVLYNTEKERLLSDISEKRYLITISFQDESDGLFKSMGYTRQQKERFYKRELEAKGLMPDSRYTDRYSYNRAKRFFDPATAPDEFLIKYEEIRAERIARARQLADQLTDAVVDLEEKYEWLISELEALNPDGDIATERAKLDAIAW